MRIIFAILFTLLTSEAFSEVHKFVLDNGLKVIVKEDI